MAKTTTIFQRFKSQNLGGKYYPWFKPYKLLYDVVDSRIETQKPTIVYRCRPTKPVHQVVTELITTDSVKNNYRLQETDSRRSSDCYEEPIGLRTDAEYGRETSIIDGPKRLMLRDVDDPGFLKPKRLVDVKALPEDDMGAKLISFIWWFLFLLGRMLAISSFAYFYPTEIIWLLASHFILVVALLLYDVRHDEVRRAKAIFFAFIGFVYLFCLIEFKIIFKKPRFIYNGFFLLMFVETFTMVFVWWSSDVEDIMNDWWYKYMFYIILTSSALSLFSMLFYLNVLKPKKIVIDTVPQS